MFEAIMFAIVLVGSLVGLMTVLFALIVSGGGIKEMVRSLWMAPLFGLTIGGIAIIPAILGALLGWWVVLY